MLGRKPRRHAVGAKFCSHAALGPAAESDLDDLVGSQLREAETPKRLHMHKDVWSAIATCQKPETADPIEPLDPGPLPFAFGIYHHMGTLRQL
jgi:hypothetical protein